MIVVTGADGFIGSNLCQALNNIGLTDLICVDFSSRKYIPRIKMTEFAKTPQEILWWLAKYPTPPEAVIHLGAITDTSAKDGLELNLNNFWFPMTLWNYCAKAGVPFIYASSAATYGDGAMGFDDEQPLNSYVPLNPYAESKHKFDCWAAASENQPPRWYGLKFFNVYGRNEGHKGKMASMVHQSLQQIRTTGKVKLFKGDFKRDFIHVADVVQVIFHFIRRQEAASGIYNVGTGVAIDFAEIAESIFYECGMPSNIERIDMPNELRPRYQTFSQATTKKLIGSGFTPWFTPLAAGIRTML